MNLNINLRREMKWSYIKAKLIAEAILGQYKWYNSQYSLICTVGQTSSLGDPRLEEDFTFFLLVKFCQAHAYLQSGDDL